jgi:hypothetical protein
MRFVRRALAPVCRVLAAAGCAAAGNDAHRDAPPSWQNGTQSDLAPECRRVPYLAGDYFRAFVPSGSRYLNDHTLKSLSPADYVRTNVLCSTDPKHFAWRPIADLRAHAAEIVRDGERWSITTCGWTKSIGEMHRGLSFAPLEWAERGAPAKTVTQTRN